MAAMDTRHGRAPGIEVPPERRFPIIHRFARQGGSATCAGAIAATGRSYAGVANGDAP